MSDSFLVAISLVFLAAIVILPPLAGYKLRQRTWPELTRSENPFGYFALAGLKTIVAVVVVLGAVILVARS